MKIQTTVRKLQYIFNFLLLLFVVLILIHIFPYTALANQVPPDELDVLPSYTVAPGDTLVDIANRFGTTVHTLMQRNSLQSPAHIFPGQTLTVGSVWSTAHGSFERYLLPVGVSLLDVSRYAEVTWERLAKANRILYPTLLVPGYSLVIPDSAGHAAATQTRSLYPTAVSMIDGLPLLTVLKMNPFPVITGESLIVPASLHALRVGNVPFPLLEVNVNAQPLIRGTTAQFHLTAASPITCTLGVLDQQVPCYQDTSRLDDELHYTVLLGLSPLLDPGEYTATLSMLTQTGDLTAVPLTLLVTAGRYDYERIDLPADRISLLDPVLSQEEREKIAALRIVRTPDKLWSLPFNLPLLGSVTSFYGSRRSYGYGFTSYHAGTDFRAQIGVPVSAPALGTVVLAEPLVVRGNAIILDHGWGIMTGYWHLSRIDVAVGQVVDRGDLIGAVGNTGLSTAPHLHWELWVNGVSVNPMAWVEPDAALFQSE